MRKRFFYAAAMAAMLASCTENVTPDVQPTHTPAKAGETAIGFGAYTDRGITRAGAIGSLTTEGDNGSLSLKQQGFGVFAYYTDNLGYTGSTKPNFMYNQKVSVNTSGVWAYEPVKYWPNEYGDNAQSADVDKVSFFAYAPYVEADDPAKGTVADGDGTTTASNAGIMGFTKNTASGDPLVKYQGSLSLTQQVDLCWGTVHSSATNWATLSDESQSFKAGLPWIDVEHPAATEQKMMFNFRHALAQLNVQIDVDADEITHANNKNSADEKTRVYVQSVTFNGFAQKGTLNLNNTSANSPLWLNYNGQGLLSESSATSVTVSGGNLNPDLRSGSDRSTALGVTGTLKNLFNPSELAGDDETKRDAPLYVIPNGEAMTVTIAYTVETEDANLSGKLSDGTTPGSKVQNKITRAVSFGGSSTLAAGNKYTLKLHLGLNSVKFDAAMTDWTGGYEGNAWLPSNDGNVGKFDAALPLTINGITTTAKSINNIEGLTGASATQYLLPMQSDVDGTLTTNIVTMSTTEASTSWSVDNDVVQIAATSAPAAGTRAGDGDGDGDGDGESSEVSWIDNTGSVTSQYILIKPMKKGQATITATAGGHTSTCVITVDAPSIKLTTTDNKGNTVSADKMTLYLFKDNNTKTLKGEMVAASYETSNSENVTFSYTPAEGETAFVEISDEGVVTPKAEGTATITAKSDKTGATATCEVTVVKPTLTAASTTISLRKGYLNSKQIELTATPADLELEFTDNTSSKDFYKFDSATRIVQAVKDGDGGTIEVHFKGHTTEGAEGEEGDPTLTFNIEVISKDPGIKIEEADSKGVTVGYAIADNGLIYKSTSQADTWGHSTIALVAVKENGIDSDATYNKFLAIASDELSGTYFWRNTNDKYDGLKYYADYTNDGNDAFKCMSGIADTKIYVDAEKNTEGSVANLLANYSVEAPEGTSGWFIPSIGQWNKIMVSLVHTDSNPYNNRDTSKADLTSKWGKNVPMWEDRNNGYMASNFNLNSYGISNLTENYYASSTECKSGYVWLISFGNGSVNINGNIHYKRHVRFVLAF